MNIVVNVTLTAVGVESKPLAYSPAIIAETARMAVRDAVKEQEVNGFVHDLRDEIALEVKAVTLPGEASDREKRILDFALHFLLANIGDDDEILDGEVVTEREIREAFEKAGVGPR